MPCKECKRVVYDDQWNVAKRGGLPILRQPKDILPCHRGLCPKGTPDDEPELTLSERNWRAIAYWHQAKGTCGQVPVDDLARENMGLIETVMRANGAAEQAKATLAAMAPLFVAMGTNHGGRNKNDSLQTARRSRRAVGSNAGQLQ